MTITAICPHCEEEFQLQPDLVGKTIRCPNFDCREPFTVAAKEQASAPPVVELPKPEPVKPSVLISDFLPILEAEPTAKPYERIEAEVVKPIAELPTARLLPKKDDLPVAKILGTVPVAKALPTPKVEGPKELDWSASMATPTDLPATPAAPEEPQEMSLLDDPMLRRRRQRSWPQYVLIGLIISTILFGGGAYGWSWYVNRDTEAKLATDATEAYESANYGGAATLFDRLAKEYSKSENVPKYLFLHRLSSLRGTLSGVTAKEAPQPGVKAYQEFVKELTGSPFAKADGTAFGGDIYAAGRQVIDNQTAYAEAQTNEFKADRAVIKPLENSEGMLEDARKVIPLLQPFKAKDSPPLDVQYAAIEKVTAMNRTERHRLSVLDPYRGLPDSPTDEGIEKFEQVLRKEKLDGDREAQDIVTKAKIKLKELIVSTKVSIPSIPAPLESDPSLAYTSAVEKPPTAPGQDRKRYDGGEIFLAVSRGVLYAFEATNGTPLWFARVSPPNVNAELPVRATLGEGGLEVAIVPVQTAGQAGLTVRNLLTGEPVWHQNLEAAVAGRPIPFRDRVFVALKDPLGTIAEIDLLTGTRVGQFALRQPVGPGMALDPGGGLLYVAAAARRVFVLDVGRRDEDGRRMPPKCLQILATEHAPDGLLCEPIPIGITGPTSGQRYLIVSQKIDPNTMKLRSFALPDIGSVADLSDLNLTAVAELTVPGWLTFPPASDGERVSFVTDQGRIAIFGVKQQDNLDRAMFSLPIPETPGKPNAARGQVVIADEDGYWAIVDGQLSRLRAQVGLNTGLRLAPVGTPQFVGEPLHRAQVDRRRESALIVVRNPITFGCRAICFDPRDGRIKWQRQLGAASNAGSLRMADSSLIAVDEDGGTILVPSTTFDAVSRVASDDWNLAKAPMRPTGRSYLAEADSGKVAWILTPETPDQTPQLRIRKVTGSQVTLEKSLAVAAKIAGQPLPLEGSLLIPMSDGIVYRFDPAESKLLSGPTWRRQDQAADAICYLSPSTKPGEFHATDGANGVGRWTWVEKGEKSWSAVYQKGWEAIGSLTCAPVIAGDALILVDVNGISAFPANAPGEPIRRWKDAKNVRQVISINGKAIAQGANVMCLDPKADGPAWDWKPEPNRSETVGMKIFDNRVYVTDGDGQITVVNLDNGRVLVTVMPSRAGMLPAEGQAAIPLGKGRIVLPLMDGTSVLLLAGE